MNAIKATFDPLDDIISRNYYYDEFTSAFINALDNNNLVILRYLMERVKYAPHIFKSFCWISSASNYIEIFKYIFEQPVKIYTSLMVNDMLQMSYCTIDALKFIKYISKFIKFDHDLRLSHFVDLCRYTNDIQTDKINVCKYVIEVLQLPFSTIGYHYNRYIITKLGYDKQLYYNNVFTCIMDLQI